MTQERKSCLKSETVLQFDIFGTPMYFNFANGSDKYRSAFGSCFTFLIFLVTLIFTITQIRVLKDRMDTVYTTSIDYEYFDQSHELRVSEDFNFMLAFQIYDIATMDYKDKLGRAFDEVYEIEVGIFENYVGQ